MLLSLASATQPAPPQAPARAETQNTVPNVVALRPGSPSGAPPATAYALPPVAQSAQTPQTGGLLYGHEILLQAQARTVRDQDLARLGQIAANQMFQASLREFGGDTSVPAPHTLRNGVVTLRLRSEADARLAQNLYERYQKSRLLGATAEEIEELETRFARLAGWPPLPPVRAETAHGGSLRGISDAISLLDARLRADLSDAP